MRYRIHSFRNAEVIFENDPRYMKLWREIQDVLDEITDEDIIEKYNNSTRVTQKSISDAINILLDERLAQKGWKRQSPIFNESVYRPKSRGRWWTLDFSKEEISVEVAFNHGEATAWNLLKPVLAGELNHVEKAIQTSAGIIITATDDMKLRGNLDGSTGSFEKFLQYLNPLRNILTVPMIIIGLEQPPSFFIDKVTKTVTDISEFVINKKYKLAAIKEVMDSYGANYKTSTNLTRGGVKISMSIKDEDNRIAVMKETPTGDRMTILNDEGWNVICLDTIHSEDDLKEILLEIEVMFPEQD